MGLFTKVHPSGRRVLRAKQAEVYKPPAKSVRGSVARERRRARYDYQVARQDRRGDRRGGWGLFSK